MLDRFNAGLCARLLGDDGGAFRTLTRSSLLFSPLDRSRTWFRCHHLVRDALRARLAAERARRERASCTAAPAPGSSQKAARASCTRRCATTSPRAEWDLAAELLARHALAFVQSGALGGRAREWLAGFPPAVVREDARLGYVSRAARRARRRPRRAATPGWPRRAAAGWDGPMPDGTASLELAGACLAALLCFDDLGGAVAAADEALAALPAAAPAEAGDPRADRLAPVPAGRPRRRSSATPRQAREGREPPSCACCRSSRTSRARCSRSSPPSAATSTAPPRTPPPRWPLATAGRSEALRTRCR